jgi:hypothetical protein
LKPKETRVPHITLKQDNLNKRNTEFEQTPLTEPVFINSVPKCGTHLLRNIMRMFVPVEQQYHATFIQYPNLAQHPKALDPREPKLAWGHLLFADSSAMFTNKANHIFIVRDPYDWVLARARFFMSEEFSGHIDHLTSETIEVEDLLNMAIFGIVGKMPPLQDMFTHNAISWLGGRANMIRFEELIAAVKDLDSVASYAYFTKLFDMCHMTLPNDWRERVRIGSDREQSGTARENLTMDMEIPDSLPEMQRKMVDYAAPGLRAILGYYD